jgi:hypothetical protein
VTDVGLLKEQMRGDGPISELARLRLALLDPRVASRIGKVSISVEGQSVSQRYGPEERGMGPAFPTDPELRGTVWKVMLRDARGDVLADAWYHPSFPGKISTSFTGQIISGSATPARIGVLQIIHGILAKRSFDQSVLAEIAVDREAVEELRVASVALVTSQALLARLAVGDQDSEVRWAAVEKLTDQTLLAKIALEDKDGLVHKAAVERLTDQALLGKMGMWIRPELTSKVSDQTLLARIALEAMDLNVRLAAVERLTDRPALNRIAKEADDEWVRSCARTRLGELTNKEKRN